MSVIHRYRDSLDLIDQNLIMYLKSGDRYLNGSLDYLKTMRGKMLRPMLSLISAKISEQPENLSIATALEMLHIGTLIHDDVIDESKLRRSQESIQSKYSKEYAIYMGDYMFSSLFVYLADTDINKETLVILANVMQKICIAEMKQWHHRYNLEQSVREYLRIISGKTASLFSLSLASGSDDLDLRRRLQKIGYHLGMAFQIQDDLLDFEGDQVMVGKELYKDLTIGNYNLPILYAIEQRPEIMRRLLLEQADLTEDIRHQVVETSAYQATRDLLDQYFAKIDREIQLLPDNAGRSDLIDLVEILRTRAI